MNRHEIRENAMILLFESSLRDDPISELYEIADEIDDFALTPAVRELVDGTLAHLEEIDAEIQKLSPRRAVSRIPKINLTLLRLAIYEALYDDGTPTGAAVSEAIVLAEKYTGRNDVRFINGVLGAFARGRESAGS